MNATVEQVNITVVFDNNPYDERLRTGWGFACHIQGTEKTILFDTGANGEILLSNMEKLGIEPESVDVVVISHAHHDHYGGLMEFVKRAQERHLSAYVPRSLPDNMKRAITQANAELAEPAGPARICRGVYSTGELGTAIKEQSLLIETQGGAILVTGCAHPGIATVVKEADARCNVHVHSALGGFHLAKTGAGAIGRIVAELKELGVKRIGPCHCSGDEVRRLFREAYDENFLPLGVGYRLSFPCGNAHW